MARNLWINTHIRRYLRNLSINHLKKINILFFHQLKHMNSYEYLYVDIDLDKKYDEQYIEILYVI